MASNIDVVRAHYAASARGDLDGMLADFAPEIVWVECAGFPTAGTYVGTAAIVDGVFGPTAATWDGFAVHVDRLADCGDTVIAIGNYVATHRGSGRALNARTVHIWRLAGGQVVGFEQIADSHVVAVAAGV